VNLAKVRLDPQIVGIIAAATLATLLPVSGQAAVIFGYATKAAIALLFFLYGARLPREVVVAGLIRWRLHLTVLSITFVIYPLISFVWPLLPTWLLAAPLVPGMVYLCCLPSTVQSNVAMVAGAKGDIAAALCTATMSNLIGICISPLIVGALLKAQGASLSVEAIESVVVQLLLPFAAGQLVHPWLGPFTQRHRNWLTRYDRVSIIMIVYGAFSAAMVGGVWKQVSPMAVVTLVLLCASLLATILTLCLFISRRLGFPIADEIVVVICGTQKGMVVGAPMASLLFPPETVGIVLLPVMVYHQLQLITCAVIAGRYAQRAE